MDSIEEKCRVCLQVDGLNDLTLQSQSDEKISLQIAFETITSIYVSDNDKDRYLCRDCVSKLMLAYEFRCQALNSCNLLVNQVETVIATQLDIKQEKDYDSDQGDADDFHFQDLDPWVKLESELHVKDEQLKLSKKKKVDPAKRIQWKRTEKALKLAIKKGERDNFLNKAHCRFCLMHFPTKLGEHERGHIGKCIS